MTDEDTETVDADSVPPATDRPVIDAGSLEAVGYKAIRGALLNGANIILGTDLETVDAAIAFTERGIRTMRADSADPALLDNADNELRILKAARHFHRELYKIAEGAQARDRIRV